MNYRVTTYNKDVLFSVILQVRNSGRAWLGGSSAPFGVDLSHLLGCRSAAVGLSGLEGQEDFSHVSVLQDSLIGCPLSLHWTPSQQGDLKVVRFIKRQLAIKGRWELLGFFQAGPGAGMVLCLPHSVGQSF